MLSHKLLGLFSQHYKTAPVNRIIAHYYKTIIRGFSRTFRHRWRQMECKNAITFSNLLEVPESIISFSILQHHSEARQHRRDTEAKTLCYDETQDQYLLKNWAENQGAVQTKPR